MSRRAAAGAWLFALLLSGGVWLGMEVSPWGWSLAALSPLPARLLLPGSTLLGVVLDLVPAALAVVAGALFLHAVPAALYLGSFLLWLGGVGLAWRLLLSGSMLEAEERRDGDGGSRESLRQEQPFPRGL